MSGLLPVDEAIRRILADLSPTEIEQVRLDAARGRVLAAPLVARRTQPPFAVSAMDGYAVRAADLAASPSRLKLIGNAPAGHRFHGTLGAGETVRIFTGAPLPDGSDSVLLQEDATVDGDVVVAQEAVRPGQHARPRGLDFAEGQELLAAGSRLGMRQLALAAAMNHAELPVRRRPRIAFMATGDELVLPGAVLGDDQIVASSGFGLTALIEGTGGEAIDLGIIADDREALGGAIDRAIDHDADVVVTLGGASVGDHDFVQEVLRGRGMALDFWKIAMRPGKPLMFGRLRETRVLGLPGNPVSTLVCALLFLRPLIEGLLGLPQRDPTETAQLGGDLPANDRRQDYLRATLMEHRDGTRVATALPRQDSSMLSTFAAADCLIVRPPLAPESSAGESCAILRLP